MADSIDTLMDQYDGGALTRRQLVRGLLLLAATPGLSAAEQSAPRGPLAPALGYNHVRIGVSDHERSAQFYGALVGLKNRAKGTGAAHKPSNPNWTFTLPGSKPDLGMWMSMFDNLKPGTIGGFSFATEIPDAASAARLAAAINKMFPFAEAAPSGYNDPKGLNPHRAMVTLKDPDGLRIALHSRKDDGWLPGDVPKQDF
jgi:catechol 2,3-dioxygenase-like lactoylglutathione lyase family enzyme